VAAERLARACGARLRLHAIEIAPLAARACAARLELLGCDAEVQVADAFSATWPEADLVLANPPFVRHEALSAAQKAAAVRATGLSARADLSAHFATLAIRRAAVAALVWPRALFTSRSALPLIAEARDRGGFALLLRSRAAGSFAASVDTCLAVWQEGTDGRVAAESTVPLGDLDRTDLLMLARGRASPRVPRMGEGSFSARGGTSVGAIGRGARRGGDGGSGARSAFTRAGSI